MLQQIESSGCKGSVPYRLTSFAPIGFLLFLCETCPKYPPGGNGIVFPQILFSLLLRFGSVVVFQRNDRSKRS